MSRVPADQTSTRVPADRAAMTLSPIAVTMAPGTTLQFTLSGAPGAPKWSSSRPSVATVNKTGMVTAKALGIAVITVKAGSARENSTVTVATGPPPPPVLPTAVLALSGPEQNPISVSTTGTSGGSAAIASGSLDWGDGQTTPFTGPPQLLYSHTYATAGPYTIGLSILTTTGLTDDAPPVSVTIPAAPLPPGWISFPASTDHASVTSYEARLHPPSSVEVLATTNLGKPVPVAGIITVDLTAFFAQQPIGVYTLSVVALAPGGSAESVYSNDFSLPL